MSQLTTLSLSLSTHILPHIFYDSVGFPLTFIRLAAPLPPSPRVVFLFLHYARVVLLMLSYYVMVSRCFGIVFYRGLFCYSFSLRVCFQYEQGNGTAGGGSVMDCRRPSNPTRSFRRRYESKSVRKDCVS